MTTEVKKTDPDSKPAKRVRKTEPKNDRTAGGYKIGKIGTHHLPNGITVKTN